MRFTTAAGLAVATVVAAVTASAATSASAASSAAQTTWPANGVMADGVSCHTDKSCLAVDPVLSWNGNAWHRVSAKLGIPVVLNAVSCPGTSGPECVAVGSGTVAKNDPYSGAIADVWDGKSWKPAVLGAGGISELLGVSCASTASCLTVGDGHSPEGGFGGAIAYSWNGTKWANVPVPGTTGLLAGVSCVAGPFCVAVGQNNSGTNRTLIDKWNGSTLTAMKPAGVRLALDSVSCTSAVSCLAVGNGAAAVGTAAEVWNGKTWTATKPIAWGKGAASPWADSVSCATARYCVAVGVIDRNPRNDQTATGRAAASLWNGKQWTPLPVGAPGKGRTSQFASVTCLRNTFCVATGATGKASTAPTAIAGFWNGTKWHVIAT